MSRSAAVVNTSPIGGPRALWTPLGFVDALTLSATRPEHAAARNIGRYQTPVMVTAGQSVDADAGKGLNARLVLVTIAVRRDRFRRLGWLPL